MAPPRIVVLAGGVGAARFLLGLTAAVAERDIVIVGNVGDDIEVSGLHVSPDLDTVLYTLTGEADVERGWGVRGDTTRALERARGLGHDAWFTLGDLDIGLHLARTHWLQDGMPLSVVTRRLADALGLRGTLLPATDDRLRTRVGTADGELDFQEWYVHRGHADTVTSLRFDGAATARAAPGVVAAIESADAIVIAPSNPLISIGPIVAVAEIDAALRARRCRCVAVSPIVAGAALRGPAAVMLQSLGHEVSPRGVAAMYEGLIDGIVIDSLDADLADGLGVDVAVTDTVMRDDATRRALAQAALTLAGVA